MPRKTKEDTDKMNKIEKTGSKLKKVTEKATPKVNKSEKSPKKVAKSDVKNASKTAKDTKAETKKAPVKKASKKIDNKKASTKKSTVVKQTAEKKNTEKKAVAKRTSTSKVQSFSPEYYDLPFKYDKTIVRILVQTPTNLFVYWEISDKDRENLKKQYGEYIFEITKPVLIVKNLTKNYSFEVDVDDFANCWYIKVNDSNCEYKIELGRRPIPVNYNYIPQYDIEKNGPIEPIKNEYIYISTSNELESPNDHVLFNLGNKITFRNIKTNKTIEKDISEFPFVINNQKFENVYDIYKYLFKEDFTDNQLLTLKTSSSSGGIPGSSEMLSSR